MPLLASFDPPALLTDFDSVPHQRDAWSAFVSETFDQAVARVESEVGAGRSPYYNPTKVDTDAGFISNTIRWKGFPLVIKSKHPGNPKARGWRAVPVLSTAFKEADTLLAGGERAQDEYLEWHVEKNGAGKITRVTFTCEPPEYWEALAQGYPDSFEGQKIPGVVGDQQKVLQLYRQFISPDVQMSDLFSGPGQKYNRLNKWNTKRGAMHLQQRNNTLGAEIFIGGDATVLRQKNGQILTDPVELTDCGGFGVSLRASDPHIGSEVNTLARQGFAITLQNPVGLYMEKPDTTGWQTPDGTDPATFWTRLRGTEDATVRAAFEVPASKGYAVGDIKIGGAAIEFGGQIAEHVTVKLTGIACRQGTKLNAAEACVGLGAVALAGGKVSRATKAVQ
jgi:hypothetical protein